MGGQGAQSPAPGKLQVAIGFFTNSGMDLHGKTVIHLWRVVHAAHCEIH